MQFLNLLGFAYKIPECRITKKSYWVWNFFEDILKERKMWWKKVAHCQFIGCFITRGRIEVSQVFYCCDMWSCFFLEILSRLWNCNPKNAKKWKCFLYCTKARFFCCHLRWSKLNQKLPILHLRCCLYQISFFPQNANNLIPMPKFWILYIYFVCSGKKLLFCGFCWTKTINFPPFFARTMIYIPTPAVSNKTRRS